ncbi:LTA synthase family protein [Steroidobacter flavus]|uniref:LTA synthase family protein n=1 Tax=Steroidobacter flavus TaxID=1842136 RepID=A0ABV8T519_9GAMM
MAIGYVLLVSYLDPALPWPITFSRAEPWTLLFLNLVPVLILHGALLIVTRRLLLSCWLTVLALGALYFINYIKLKELATPLLPDDFHFLKAIGVNYAFFAQYLASSRLQLLLAIGVLAITLLLYRERPIGSIKGGIRWGAAVLTVILWSTLVQGSAPWKTVYYPGQLQFEPWAPRDSAARTGLITNMILLHWELRGDSQLQPNIDASVQLLRDYGLTSTPPVLQARSPLPDIIVVQSESLFDVTRLNGIDTDVMPTLHAAASRGWSGELRVPTFGGGTIRTEFEFLTGLPLAAFPHVRYPYLQLAHAEIPSLVRELRSNGYRTVAIHPNGGAFWNRNHAFRALGFDQFLDADAFEGADRYGWYVSDASLVDRVIAELRDDDPPQMIMAISIQNHGPYETVPLPSSENPRLVQASLDASSTHSLETYMTLVQASDQALARLFEFVENRSRDTILLVYGDHLPALNDVYAQLGFRDGRKPEEQPVPWLLIDNRSREPRVQDGPAWLLPTLLVEKTGLATSRYFSELTDLGFANAESRIPFDVLKVLARLQFDSRLGLLDTVN